MKQLEESKTHKLRMKKRKRRRESEGQNRSPLRAVAVPVQSRGGKEGTKLKRVEQQLPFSFACCSIHDSIKGRISRLASNITTFDFSPLSITNILFVCTPTTLAETRARNLEVAGLMKHDYNP
ncbi:hypothetical protein NL676_013462 [Syzygium grande]|nr:hypothetical protein NL676_013462 [Syzygium grande]